MRYFFGGPFLVGTDVSSFLNCFVHLIANAQIKYFSRDYITLKLKPLPEKFPTLKQAEQASFFLTGLNKENAGSKALRKPSSCSVSMRQFLIRGF